MVSANDSARQTMAHPWRGFPSQTHKPPLKQAYDAIVTLREVWSWSKDQRTKFSIRLGTFLLALTLLGACGPSDSGQDAAPETSADATSQSDAASHGDSASNGDSAAADADIPTDVAVLDASINTDGSGTSDASSGD
jgi:hypothetical protein